MGVSAANSAFVGFPVLIVALPSLAGLVLGLNMIVENLVTIPLALLLMERARGERSGYVREVVATIGRLARNPMIGAIVLGVVFSVFRLPVPDVVTKVVDIFGRASTAVALFSIGGMLVGLSVRGRIRQIAVVSFGKLVLHPALVAGALWLVVALGMPRLGRELTAALVLSAAMPVMTTYAVLGQQYDEEEVPPAVLLVSTAASFLTLSALLAYFRVGV